MALVVEGFHRFTYTQKSPICLSTTWNESYLPLLFQSKLVLTYRPWSDGRLSWPRHHQSTAMSRQSVQRLSVKTSVVAVVLVINL